MMGSVEKMGNYNLKQEVTDKYSLRGRVFSKLRADILSGKYKDHEELKEVAIGEELGVSRTPVREAFRQLELEGLIQIIPNKGAYVTGITAKDVQDIYMIRSLLEGLCARWATEHITEIADWKQQQKNQLPASPFPSCFRPFWPPSAMVLIKIDFLGKWMADIEMDCQDVKACPSLRFLDFLPLLPGKYGTSHFLPYCHRH